jgi:hypothetical protein
VAAGRANSATTAEQQVRGLLSVTMTRLRTAMAVRGAAVAVVLFSVWLARGLMLESAGSNRWSITRTVATAVGAALIGAIAGWWRGRASSPRDESTRAAVALEHRLPNARNLLVTAAELLHSPPSGNEEAPLTDVARLVVQRAGTFAQSVQPAALIPLRRDAWQLAGSVGAMVLVLVLLHNMIPTVTAPVRSAIAGAGGRIGGDLDISQVTVRVVPPSYTRRPTTTTRDPARIDALAGSVITVTLATRADSVIVATRDSTQSIARRTDGTFTFTQVATADGFLGLLPRAADGRSGTRKLIGLTVRSDAAPRVRIVSPARDMIVPDAKRSIPIGVQADDDLALGTLRLRYTKVAGSGERFTFSEGEIPLSVARATPAEWTARATLALEPLLQEPGDLVVYRAVATDTRPGAPAVESDAFIAELAAPGGVAALGFSLDPDEDRYALSQQMVILKTERLLAQRATLAPEALAEQAMQLAGEQRRVRAEFVFMMGGEFAQQVTGEDGLMELDEHEEAESEGDLAAGRMVNRGRTALLSAVRAMSRAAVALTTAELAPALSQEKFALEQLQEAFARNRFLMRALSQREQLDLTRRLTGRLDSIARERARVPVGETSARRTALRDVLAELMAAAARAPSGRSDVSVFDASVFVGMAQRVLQIDPSSAVSQTIARQLTAAGAAASLAAARPSLDSAATALTGQLVGDLRPAAPAALSAEGRALQASLQAALERVKAAATEGASSDGRRGGRP